MTKLNVIVDKFGLTLISTTEADLKKTCLTS